MNFVQGSTYSFFGEVTGFEANVIKVNITHPMPQFRSNFPHVFNVPPEAEIWDQGLQVGEELWFEAECGRPRGNLQKYSYHYYWDNLRLCADPEENEPPPPEEEPEPVRREREQRMAPRGQRPAATRPRPAARPKPTRQPQPKPPESTSWADGEERKRLSIERQTALAQAVDYHMRAFAHDGSDAKPEEGEVLNTAIIFAEFLQNG